MFFTNAVVSLLVAGAAAMGSGNQKRTTGSVYYCTGVNFTGSCNYQSKPLNTCVDFPQNYTLAVSSFGPDVGAECLLMQGHCNANLNYYSIFYPGISDLATISEDNLASSYICLAEAATRATKARILSLVS